MDTKVHMWKKNESFAYFQVAILCCDVWNLLSFLEIYFPLCFIALITFVSRFEDQADFN